MKAIIESEMTALGFVHLFSNDEALRYFLLGVATASGERGAVLIESCDESEFHITGAYENLLRLVTNTGGPGKIFSFQDVPFNKPGKMTYVISKAGMSLEEVIKAIETA